jgi:hypothetical protein
MSKKLQTSEARHEELVKGLYTQMKPVMDKSEQPIIYLDDDHKACNNRFATLLGYKSPEDWAVNGGFLDIFVAEKSRGTLSTAYWNAMQKMVASSVQLTLMKKGGGTVETTMILVPLFFEGHLFSVHFVTMSS